ncbi:Fe-S cluster assembly protein SufD [Rhodovibrionaceae bacterium A322]
MAETPATFDSFFGAAEAISASGDAPSWLTDLRNQASTRLTGLELPNPRQEAWKYSNLPRALRKLASLPVPANDLELSEDLLPPRFAKESLRLVFVNGAFDAGLSDRPDLEDAIHLGPLSELLEEDDDLGSLLGQVARADDQTLTALNDQRFQDGLLLQVAAGKALTQPIELLHLTGCTANRSKDQHPRLLILLNAQAEAQVIERHWGLDNSPQFVNQVSEIKLAQGAQLTHLRLQQEGLSTLHLASQHIQVARDARYRSFSLVSGGAFSRQEVRVNLEGQGAEVDLDGVYMLRGDQHGDIHTTIEHQVPHTAAREVFRGVLDGDSQAAFQGKLVVHPDAQKTDGRMLNKTLLLSDRAQIKTKPELEIFADDVQCAHGATTGEIDEDALFYLRSRGIGDEKARALLVQAFLAETIEASLTEGWADKVKQVLDHWMEVQDAPLAAE